EVWSSWVPSDSILVDRRRVAHDVVVAVKRSADRQEPLVLERGVGEAIVTLDERVPEILVLVLKGRDTGLHDRVRHRVVVRGTEDHQVRVVEVEQLLAYLVRDGGVAGRQAEHPRLAHHGYHDVPADR